MDANWWNNALQSYDVGRQHRADRENAQSFSEGGFDAVAQTAGRRGDLQTAMATRRFQDDERQRAYDAMETIRPLALGALKHARGLPPERRAAFLNAPHIRQRFTDFGVAPQQYDAAVSALAGPQADQFFAELEGAFRQHEDQNWQIIGRTAVAIQPDGQFNVGGTLPDDVQASEWRPATQEERQSLPAGTEWDVNVQTGERRLRYRPNAPRSGGADYPDAESALRANGGQWLD